MTDESGSVVWEGEFLPFGEVFSITGTVTNNLRFPGQYYDEETGLHYNYYRDYKPEIGRYLEADPILQPMVKLSLTDSGCEKNTNWAIFDSTSISQNLPPFIYVGNNPISFTDPIGLFTCKGKWNYWVAWSAFWCTCYWQCVPCEGTIIYSDPTTTTGQTVFDPLTSEYDCTCPQPGPEEECDDEEC